VLSKLSDKLELVAWCIMNSHLHTIAKAELETLSRAIKVINLRYRARYNRMHRRVGPVFGGRYRSEAIEENAYLLGALRYIHLNKVFVLGLLGGRARIHGVSPPKRSHPVSGDWRIPRKL